MKPKISFIGPSHRTHLWKPFFESIITDLDFEVVFVTDIEPKEDEIPTVNRTDINVTGVHSKTTQDPRFKWIYSKVKPGQCFEIAYRESTGTHIIWTGDDFTYSPYCLDNLYSMWKSFYDYKIIIACNVYQDGYSARHEHVVPWDNKIRLTTTGLISKQIIEEVGGLADSTFVCGHWDVDLMMRIYAVGGKLFECPTAIAYEPHNEFHKIESNFAPSWAAELEYFKSLWLKDGKTTFERQKTFKPYLNENILTESQGIKGNWV